MHSQVSGVLFHSAGAHLRSRTPLKQGIPLITPSDEDEAESAEIPRFYFYLSFSKNLVSLSFMQSTRTLNPTWIEMDVVARQIQCDLREPDILSTSLADA